MPSQLKEDVMKIARLFMVLLALTATALSSAPKSHRGRPGGSGIQSLTDGPPYEFYCYSNPELVYSCFEEEYTCFQNCEEVCEGPCDWEWDQNLD